MVYHENGRVRKRCRIPGFPCRLNQSTDRWHIEDIIIYFKVIFSRTFSSHPKEFFPMGYRVQCHDAKRMMYFYTMFTGLYQAFGQIVIL